MYKKIGLALGTLGFLAVAGVAFAQTASTATSVSTSVTTPSQQMVLQVGPAGKVLLRGTIDSVSATSITVKSWGGDWTVNVSASASVMPQGVALTDFKQGDFVGVQGTVNSSAGWTVDATLVRDWTARQALNQQVQANTQSMHTMMSSGPRTIQGTLSGLSGQTFTLTASNGTAYSVSLASGALLLTQGRATLDFSKVSNGDTVRVYGTVSSSTISASIFRDVSVSR